MSADAARLTIDLDAVAANYAVLCAQAGPAETAPVVKADGYGMGASQVGLRLWSEGARTFYVARLSEGEALRAAFGDRDATILVFDGVTPDTGARLQAANLIPVLNSVPQIAEWQARAVSGRLPAALHIDTGMNRLGLTPAQAQALADDPAGLKGLDLNLVISHLACASEPDHAMNVRQQQAFAELRRLFPQARASLSSSGGVFMGRDFAFDQVRPGVSLYGAGPHNGHDPRLTQVARLEAPILQLRDIPAGDSVGYGAAFIADRPLQVGIIAAGYADGYLRASSPAGAVWYAGARRRLLGRISMDLIAIDLSDTVNAAEGDLVELIGPNMTIDEAAAAAGGSPYELLVRIGLRSHRRWIGQAG